MSPSTMNEEERRDLIARQHRALYGREGSISMEGVSVVGVDGLPPPRTGMQVSTVPTTMASVGRGSSPLSLDHFRMGGTMNNHHQQQQQQQQALAQKSPHPLQPASAGVESEGPSSESVLQGSNSGHPSSAPARSRSPPNSNASPTSNPTNFSLFDHGHHDVGHHGSTNGPNPTQQSSRTSASSPSGSPPRQGASGGGNGKLTLSSGVAPIGTRPSPVGTAPTGNGGLAKRATTPLPSPLSHGFVASSDDGQGPTITSAGAHNERSTSAASNPSIATTTTTTTAAVATTTTTTPTGGSTNIPAVSDSNVGLVWGNKNGGVWGTTKNPLGVQASVWG